ncbi:MAG: thioredoxin [Elusimicrobia bacterium RIFOXYA12_FULL_51_18]|nr:MAG: thioredoxin [Elusimicrobia bacterium RIFOXYA12_FULL_51_18]OGS31848.1 MAG: thioredoxin [Elusimicrobia bacterium RIFOXYA2_FULL_53_38]
MSNEIQLTDATFDQEVIKSVLPVLVDFWAPWCGPCKMIAPVIEELAKEYEGKVKVCKLNTDEGPESASAYKISAIPTVLLFKGGKLVQELVGLQPKEELKRRLDELIK